jgi:hypothetical protein
MVLKNETTARKKMALRLGAGLVPPGLPGWGARVSVVLISDSPIELFIYNAKPLDLFGISGIQFLKL